MSIKSRAAAIGAGLLIAGAGAVAAAPIASAFAVAPAPGGGSVHLNSTEAGVLHQANIGGAVDALTGWGPGNQGQTFGETIDDFSGAAARYPNGTFSATVVNLGTPAGHWYASWTAR